MPEITVSKVPEDGIREFVEFPYRLNAGSKFWVPEQKKDVISILSLSHPFWLHGRRQLFIARKNGQPAGIIAAIVNDNHNAYHKDKCGFFGFFDTIDDKNVSSALLSAAKQWLKEQGMDTMRGPMNPSTNEVCGLLIDGYDMPPKIMMPYNPPYYADHLEAFGMKKAKDLHAYIRYSKDPIPERLNKIIARAESRTNVKLRPINLHDMDREMKLFLEIYSQAWSANWGFIPMTNEEILHEARLLRPILKKQYVYFAEVDGEAAACSLIVPDVNVAYRKTNGTLNVFNIIPFLITLFTVKQGRLLTLGVKNKFRNRGIELLLIKQVILTCREVGWDHGELSWILEDNEKIISVIEAVGGKLYKRYRIYDLPIS